MEPTSKAKIAFVVVYMLAGSVATAYLAAAIYFLLNKTLPDAIAFDTWHKYWTFYADDAVQRKRLVHSGLAALATVYVAPCAFLASILKRRRSLHGDARWANQAEIRKAGLL